jgi:hypothetical protein
MKPEMLKKIRRLWLKWFPVYERLDLQICSYAAADVMIRQSERKPEDQQWVIAKEEDTNHIIGFVYLERRRRIWD